MTNSTCQPTSRQAISEDLVEEALAWVREGLLRGLPSRYLDVVAQQLGVPVQDLAEERDRQRFLARAPRKVAA